MERAERAIGVILPVASGDGTSTRRAPLPGGGERAGSVTVILHLAGTVAEAASRAIYGQTGRIRATSSCSDGSGSTPRRTGPPTLARLGSSSHGCVECDGDGASDQETPSAG